MHIDDLQFKNLVIEMGLIARETLENLHKEAQRKGVALPLYLVTMGTITPQDVRRIEAQLLGIAFVNLQTKKISFDTLTKIPEPIVRTYNIIAFRQEDEVIHVALLSIEALKAVSFLKEEQKLKIKPYFTDYASIKTALLQYQKELKKRFGEQITKHSTKIKETIVSDFRNDRQIARELQRQAEDAATAQLVETLIEHARVHHATDIHIEPKEDQVIVRYRIGGDLHEALLLAKDVLGSVVSRMKFLSRLPLTQHQTYQQGMFTIETGREKVSGQLSIVPTVHGERLTIKLTQGWGGVSLESIGFHGAQLRRVEKDVHARKGAILVAGPHGSGVTTTIYALLDAIQAPQVQITTVEGTIERTLAHATQILTRPEYGFDMHAGVHAATKTDTDILMIRELSTGDVATTALKTVQLGKMVIAGIRSQSAVHALVDLLAVGVSAERIISTVTSVIATRIIPALSEEREKFFLEKSEIRSLGKLIDLERVLAILKAEQLVSPQAQWETIAFYRPKYKQPLTQKMIGVQEVVPLSRAVAEALSAQKSASEIEAIVRAEGTLSLLEDAICKAAMGRVALSDALKVMSS